MKLSQMIVQGVWESKSTFLMLPHISQENLRHFNTKKVSTFKAFPGQLFSLSLSFILFYNSGKTVN